MVVFNDKSASSIALEVKFKEFQRAMERYNSRFFYSKMGLFVSVIVLFLQLVSVANTVLEWTFTNPLVIFILFSCAYIVADFVNGLVHMYMDNNTNYNTRLGPFIAAFHLHHIKPRYTDKHALLVYFHESGTKFWLVIYLIILVWMQYKCLMSFETQFFLTTVGVLSSFAEVAHYWCHNKNERNIVINFFQKHGVLLSKKNHMIHHADDNKNYAFLNGVSNPFINKIADFLYEGYKNNADIHARSYTGQQTDNRL